MGAITNEALEVYRAYTVDGVVSSGPNDPAKADIIALFGVVDGALTSLVDGVVIGGAVVYSTLSALNGDLAHAAGTLGVVYNDGTAANNGVYVKSGASGSGSWTITNLALPSSFAAALATLQADVAALGAIGTFGLEMLQAVSQGAALNLLSLQNVNNTSDANKPVSTAQGAAIAVVAGAVATETTRAEAAEATLTTAVGTKASSSALTAETARAEGAEGANATAITAETTRAEAAEGALSTSITTETTRAEAAEGALSTSLAAGITSVYGVRSLQLTPAARIRVDVLGNVIAQTDTAGRRVPSPEVDQSALVAYSGQVYLIGPGPYDGTPIYRKITAFSPTRPVAQVGELVPNAAGLSIATVRAAAPDGADARVALFNRLAPTPDDGMIEVFLQFGDSESCGLTSLASSTANNAAYTNYSTFPGRVQMAGAAMNINAATTATMAPPTTLQDAVESTSQSGIDVYGETGALAAAAMVYERGLNQSSMVVVNSIGVPGMRLSDWLKGGQLYNNVLIPYFTGIKNIAAGLGKGVRIRYMSYGIGLNDMNASPPTTYSTALADLESVQASLAADLTSLFGKAINPILILQMMNPYAVTYPAHGAVEITPTAKAIFDLGTTNANFRLAGPTYCFPCVDGAHSSSQGYIGWYSRAGEVMAFELNGGGRWNPLHATAAYHQTDGSVLVQFVSPYGLPLSFNTTWVQDPALGGGGSYTQGPYGLVLADGSGNLVPTQTPTVEGSNVTLRPISGSAAAGWTVEIAATYGYPQGPATGLRCNLNDGSQMGCVVTGGRSPNFACHQVVPVA